MICPNCNSKARNGMKFCPKCGSEIPQIHFCSKCGTKLKDGMSYCTKCGSSIEEGSVHVASSDSPMDFTHGSNEISYPFKQQVIQEDDERLIKEGKAEREKWQKMMLWGLAAIFFFGLVGILSNSSSNSKNESGITDYSNEYSDIQQETNVNPPKWIQGDWAVTTPYGSMGVKFQGKQMWVIDFDGTMTTGSYHYDSEQNVIFPDFYDSYFKLDNTYHRISAGQGYYFHRI